MGERIDQFCENLRVKLTGIDNNMQALKAKIDTGAKTAEENVRTHLHTVQKRLKHDRNQVATAQAEMKKWIEDRKTATDEKITEWKAKHETARLQSRADGAERYAAAAAVLALAAVDEAEHAALEAWLARKDAESAASKAA